MGFIARIKADRNPCLVQTGKDRDIIFAIPEVNPAIARKPGKRGLLYTCRMVVLNSSPWSHFVRVKSGGWIYLGEYEFSHAGVITPQQFIDLPQVVGMVCSFMIFHMLTYKTMSLYIVSVQAQEKWATKLLTSKKWEEYTEMRARIYLRKQQEDITPKAIEAALHSTGTLTKEDILEAFRRGDEVSGFWTLYITLSPS